MDYKQNNSLFNRLFKERELIFRSDGKVRFFRLLKWQQFSIFSILLFVLLWAFGTSFSSIILQSNLNKKSEEMFEAKISYDNLRDEINAFEIQIIKLNDGLTKSLNDSNKMVSLVVNDELKKINSIGASLAIAVKRIAIDLNITEDEKHLIVASRNNLHNQIAILNDNLNEAAIKINGLEGNISIAKIDNSYLNDSHTQMSVERDKLLLSVSELTNEINGLLSEKKLLLDNVSTLDYDVAKKTAIISELEVTDNQLRSKLDIMSSDLKNISYINNDTERRVAIVAKHLYQSIGNVEKHPIEIIKNGLQQNGLLRLEKQAKDIITNLSLARDDQAKMSLSIDSVLSGLGRIAGVERRQENIKNKKSDRVISLLTQISGLHDTQLDIMTRMNNQTAVNISQLENLITITGLDPERMLEISGLPSGVGGPLVETDFIDGSSDELELKVSSLEAKVNRWNVLQKIAKCLPLMSPVDYYNLTSKFGRRKDPFTGKKAIHKGIDMGGWPGTKIWSTAAGKVTFAGNSGRYGKMIEIDHGCGIKTIYGHLKKILVKKGQVVSHRHYIAKLGTSGRSTGPHVHFEVRVEGKAIDPIKFIEAGRHVFKG